LPVFLIGCVTGPLEKLHVQSLSAIGKWATMRAGGDLQEAM
jgi:hypothetical protein